MTDVRYPSIPYRPPRISEDETLRRGREFHASMDARRSVRDFSETPDRIFDRD